MCLQAIHGKQHFTSLHGKVGAINLALALAAPLLGTLSFKKLGLLSNLSEEMQPRVKWAHRVVRAVDMPAGCACVGRWSL